MDANELLKTLKPYILKEEKVGVFKKVSFNRYLWLYGDSWGYGNHLPININGLYYYVYTTYYIDSTGRKFEYYLVEEEDILRVKVEKLVDKIGKEE